MPDIAEEMQELQEKLQYHSMLKQIGANNLAEEEEVKILQLQQKILALDAESAAKSFEGILPKRCRLCEEKDDISQKLECFEKHPKTCENDVTKTPRFTQVLAMELLIKIIAIIAILLIFSLLSGISYRYLSMVPLIAFSISSVGTIIIILIFRKPYRKLISSL